LAPQRKTTTGVGTLATSATQLNAASPPPRHQFASRLNDACRSGPAAMRMGAVMMRDGSNLYVTPARVGLILVALIVLGVTVGRVITVLGQNDASTHTTRGNGGQVTVDIGVADLRGSLP
jgi:hypothetical protein